MFSNSRPKSLLQKKNVDFIYHYMKILYVKQRIVDGIVF